MSMNLDIQKEQVKLKCPKHPNYRAMNTPKEPCKQCWDIFRVRGYHGMFTQALRSYRTRYKT